MRHAIPGTARRLSASVRLLRTRRFDRLPDDRHTQAEAGASTLRALDADLAAVGLCDLAHDREAEPRPRQSACGAGAVEAVEHERQVLVVDAGPVVANRHLA